jgi:[ribosomal protein S5]-alanine N-acetyltransferase
VRVLISPPTPADEEAFIAANVRSRRLHGRWSRGPETPEEYATYLAKAAEERRRYFFARMRDGGDLVGFLNLGEIIRGSLDQAFLGYAAFSGFEGRGLMSEAMQMVLREAFGPLKLHRVEANIQPGNRPSLLLAERNGFTREGFSPRYLKLNGRWRDHERWAINAEQWREFRRGRRLPFTRL